MLSAFAARPIVELKPRDKFKVESVLAHGDRVFVGLSTGSLRIYRVKQTDVRPQDDGETSDNESTLPNQPPDSNSIELFREEEKFSRKPVQQLAIIKEAAILISLSDAHVSFYDLETYALSERLEKTKGATCFATARHIERDPETGIHSIVSRMAVAVKRKIMLWTWQDFELTSVGEEMNLPASVKSLTWATGTRLVVGMDPGFSMVNLDARTVTDINRSAGSGEPGGPNGTRFGAVNASGMGYMGMGSWVPKPMAAALSSNEIILVKDVNSLFIDSDGNPLEKRQVPWAGAPEAIAYSYPYLLSLSTKGGLELRNPETLSLLQTISLPSATLLHVPQPNISLAHAGKGFLVASDRCIWQMDAIGYGSQIDDLLNGARFDEALSLVNLIEGTLLLDKDARIQQIKIAKAYFLFERREYREALELFSSAPARPDQVIALYPKTIAGHLSQHEASSDTGGPSTETTLLSTADLASTNLSPRNGTDEKAHTGVSHHRTGTDTESILSTGTDGPGRTIASGAPLEGRNLSLAINELRAFLAQTRVQLQKYIDYDGTLKATLLAEDKPATDLPQNPDFAHFIHYDPSDSPEVVRQKLFNAATLVDTTLFRAYMLVSPSLVGSLFRLENFCAADVVEEKLYASGRYNELIDFLWGKKLHEEALKLLESFGTNETPEEALNGFRGPQRTVQYLQQLPFELIDLILQFSEWPMKSDPEAGMQVFLADTENAESLPRDRVLEFLEKFDARVVIKYLEHVIGELNDDSALLHDRLAELYVTQLKDNSTSASAAEMAVLRGKLEAFLKSEKGYDKNRVLKSLPINDERFYESRATVLSKLSFHKEALRIYVYQMQDPRRAEEYCNQVYLALSNSTASSLDPDDVHRPQSIYTTLLSLYLSPPSPYKQNLGAALDLLSLHGSRLPALSTLAALPESLPIKDLETYFQARMRAANSIAREEAITAAISGVEKSAWEAELLLGDDLQGEVSKTTPSAGRNRRVVLGENRLCTVCHTRFGRATARVFPDGAVSHYGCTDRKQAAGT